ncbi:MAG TPA: Ni/Fe-hydrogenase cytochrome b subunit [Candidatus Kapabacteria bacterium]|nr:Ni/Fe-hydrogenase cytochrome b subunit [Candidatus Kapabacteria bacterium]HPO62263.1 Ni/Fe-hydrogenase cytochrome b subunit [Candidatus Kapabacteria bacterium]
MERINKAKLLLWVVLGVSAAVGITRFLFGLGVTTNLTDNTPWGFWIGFDVMGGVALAAGGFVIAAVNYIFGKKEMHPIARAAILTAFLGYIAVAVGLLFDLGLPWNIWHMIIYWNPHSPLFEVGWCVMLYLTVLTLEFAPVILEKYPNIKILSFIHRKLFKIRIPLVILGIMLSTLHQSSLGSLFLAMPYRLHPLWYSPIIPVIFFVSAICLGLMMVIVESITSSYLYKKVPEKEILNKLSKYTVFGISFYILLRFADILVRGAGVFLFDTSWGTSLFWFEMLFSAFIPIIIFTINSLRKKISFIYFAALSGVLGMVFNRLNVGGLTHLNNLSDLGTFYFPAWTELAISAGVVSAAMLVFFYFIENYKVWDERPQIDDTAPEIKPKFNSFKVYIGESKIRNRSKFTFAFILAFALAFAIISSDKIYSDGFERIEVKKARGGDTLLIDGNRDGYGVSFAHKFHSDSIKIQCYTCHHLNKPLDKNSECYECHNEMYTESDVFKHDWHSSKEGANLDCFKCHSKTVSKGVDFKNQPEKISSACLKCHNDMFPQESQTKQIKSYKTYSYVDAMHYSCIKCHKESLSKDEELRKLNPNIAQCSNCHKNINITQNYNKFAKQKEYNRFLVIPFLDN